jgi:hypothetical protein
MLSHAANALVRRRRATHELVMNDSRHESGKEVLERAFDGLEQELPDRVSRAIEWLRDPKSRWVRFPIGLLFMAASFFWFLPVLGVEFFPIGLMLIAQDIPFLRRPVGKLLLWLESMWRALKRRWRTRKRSAR